MTETNGSGPADLSGTVDERLAQLTALESGSEPLSAQWLHRQLRSALNAWAEDATTVDIDLESRTDY